MKQEIAQTLVKELRSGKYRKTTGALRRKDGSCCVLGLLCMLHPGTKWIERDDEDKLFIEGRESSLPTREIIHWAGMKPDLSIPTHPVGSRFQDLAEQIGEGNDGQLTIYELNDKKDMDFRTLADFIELNWEEL